MKKSFISIIFIVLSIIIPFFLLSSCDNGDNNINPNNINPNNNNTITEDFVKKSNINTNSVDNKNNKNNNYTNENIDTGTNDLSGKDFNNFLPSKFIVDEMFSFFTTQMYITDKNEKNLGYKIEQGFFGRTENATIYDNNGNIIAYAEEEMFSWGTTINVYDNKKKLIGKIKEKLFTSFFKMWSEYNILDATGNVIALSSKEEFFDTEIIIRNNENEVMAKLIRPFNFFFDTWGIEKADNNIIDDRILAFIPIFKTIADNKTESESSDTETTN